MKPGDRVGAICGHLEGGIVEFYGYGVYVGREVPPSGVELMGVDLHDIGNKDPKIELDGGGVVWGCQCWWGAEDRIKSMLEGKTVKIVPPPPGRKP